MRYAPTSLATTLLVACGHAPPPASRPVAVDSPVAAAAVAGVDDPGLRELLLDHWEWTMAIAPVWATTLGDHRRDDRIDDHGRDAIEAAARRRRDFLARARAVAARSAALSLADRVTIALFIEKLDVEIAAEPCRFEEWNLSTGGNPVNVWNYLPEQHKVVTPADGRNLVARYRAIPRWIDQEIENLARGAAAGSFATAETTRRVLAIATAQLAAPLAEWPLLAPASQERTVARPGWSPAERADFARDLDAAVKDGIRPALERYRAFLEARILPHARGDERPGLAAQGGGAACYATQIRAFTGLARTADELHELGLAEVARVNLEMRDLGETLFATNVLDGILRRLREDPSLYFAGADEIEAKAAETVAAVKQKLPAYFHLLPRTDLVVRRVPDYEAPYTTIAYYRPPHPDGSKPGEYFVNVLHPETRPRFEAQVLAFHESIPGHHLQIALAQELPALPAFRKHLGFGAFEEGWALYAERLAEEMGLYAGPYDRMGMLSYDAWRAARLVVDTGLHARGWSRRQAIDYLVAHTALTPANIANEVDRYITWPGQALGYKVGQLEILRLRRRAEAALGAGFDLADFHEVVLGRGEVSLGVLAEQVEAWIARVSGGAGAGAAP